MFTCAAWNQNRRRVASPPNPRECDIAWSADSDKLYFVSDESGMEAIYSATVKLTRSDVKKRYEVATRNDATTKPTSRPVTGPSADETATNRERAGEIGRE